MSGVNENRLGAIESKLWAADQLITQVKDLTDRAEFLETQAKENIPEYHGDWSAQNLTAFVEKFSDSIRNPIRHKNKESLEELGVQTKGLSEEIFEDTLGCLDLASAIRDLDVSGPVVKFLLKGEIIPGWLKDGLQVASDRLKDVSNARTALIELIDECSSSSLRDELLVRCIEDTNYVEAAQDIITKVNLVSSFGIEVPDTVSFDQFNIELDSVWNLLNDLTDEYGVSKVEIEEVTKGKQLNEAQKTLKQKRTEAQNVKEQLLVEWKTYQEALKTLGHDVQDRPDTIPALQKGVQELRAKCLGTIGEGGIAILAYLSGEQGFPEQLGIEELKRTMKMLRPMFVRGLRSEDNA